MLEMSDASKKIISYEDILVSTFRKYPDVFHLKGYKEYPDTVILMRELYNLVPEGLVRIKKRKCILTDLGLTKAIGIRNHDCDIINVTKNQDELNSLRKTILLLSNLEGFRLFTERNFEKILDVDFYEFFSTSVRTSRVDIQSNVKRVAELIKEYSNYDKYLAANLQEYHKFLINYFKEQINN